MLMKLSPLFRVTFGLGLAALPFCSANADETAKPQNTPSTPISIRFRDPELPLEERLNDLLSQLTLPEKISQLGMGNDAIPRLGIPAYHWWSEGLHGVARNGTATVFPQAIALAATWNPSLLQRVGDVIATEARAKYGETTRESGGSSKMYQGITIWSPNINIFRDPRWGRGQETYGEDPFLTGQLGIGFVRGLQGSDPRYLKTVATVKHFAVHSGPEPLRHRFDAQTSARDLHETYLPAFEATIRQGGATSLMSAYNAINGVPAPGNAFLLTEVLRNEWGFQGAVVGDVGGVADMHNARGHHYVADAAAAIATAIKAGNDLCSDDTYKALPDALQRGLITEAEIDTALRRLLVLKFRLGMFDPPARVAYAQIPITENDTAAHDQLALEAARQSIVLLKNDGALPWKAKELKRVAILGPTGNDQLGLLGNYFGQPSRPSTLVKSLRAKLEAQGVKVTYDPAIPIVAGFRESGGPFSEGVLFTTANKAAPGLAGEAFDNAEFKGAPRSTRKDQQIDFFWNAAQPVPGIPIHDAHLRWTGVLVAPRSGEYEFGVTYIGAAQLFLDDEAIAGDANYPRSAHHADSPRVSSAKRVLEAGKTYRVRVESHQRPGAEMGLIQVGWRPPGGLEEALARANEADHIVLTLGITSALEGEEMSVKVDGFTGGDRSSILLPKVQRDLIDAVAALKKPFVVVLTNGSAVSFDVSKPNAIVEAWYYGQRGGDALAEILLGETAPSGRLPMTFYRSDEDLPPFENYSMENRTYRYFRGEPLFAFGHGLSYTTFGYEKFRLSQTLAKAADTVTAEIELTNTGSRDGDEVVQLYATAINPVVSAPLRQLVGFQRVTLNAGGSKTVRITFPIERLRRWDEGTKRYVVDPGAYKMVVGPASDRPLREAVLTVTR